MTFYLLPPHLRSWKRRLSAKLRGDRSQVPTEEDCPSKPPSCVQDTSNVLIQWNVICYFVLKQVSRQAQGRHRAQGTFSGAGRPAHRRTVSSFLASAARCQQSPLPSCWDKDVTRHRQMTPERQRDVVDSPTWAFSTVCQAAGSVTAGRRGTVRCGTRPRLYWWRRHRSPVIVKLDTTNVQDSIKVH